MPLKFINQSDFDISFFGIIAKILKFSLNFFFLLSCYLEFAYFSQSNKI